MDMFGMKNLSTNRLAGSLLVVSAALLVLVFAAPEAGSVTTLLTWLIGALVLLGVWAVVALEVARRYFGGGDSDSGDLPR